MLEDAVELAEVRREREGRLWLGREDLGELDLGAGGELDQVLRRRRDLLLVELAYPAGKGPGGATSVRLGGRAGGLGLAKTRFATKLAAMRLLAALVRTTVASMPFSLAALAKSAATLATIAVMDLSPLPAGGSDEDFFARDGEVLRGARGREGEGEGEGGGGGGGVGWASWLEACRPL